MTGKHIELFLVEGVPGGITTAEIAGWTGHVLAGPRSDLGDVLRRPEAKRNGAYFLLGDDEEAVGGVRCYTFGSPSSAGAIARGRSCNGRIEWKAPDGGSYGDWENRGVE